MGEINPHFKDEFKANEDFVYADFKDIANRRKYYNNKWYGFKKQADGNLKDEYFESSVIKEEKTNSFKILLLRLCFILSVVVLFDFWKLLEARKHQKFRKIQKEVLRGNELDGSLMFEDKKTNFTINLNEYIEERSKANSLI